MPRLKFFDPIRDFPIQLSKRWKKFRFALLSLNKTLLTIFSLMIMISEQLTLDSLILYIIGYKFPRKVD